MKVYQKCKANSDGTERDFNNSLGIIDRPDKREVKKEKTIT